MAKYVKCVGCITLKRGVQLNPKFPLIIYGCPQFPYWCALSGLMKPSMGIEKAADECPVDPSKSCVVCGTSQKLQFYGLVKMACICATHDRAWGRWLDEHEDKRRSFSPRGRVVRAKWIEVFREFVQDARQRR